MVASVLRRFVPSTALRTYCLCLSLSCPRPSQLRCFPSFTLSPPSIHSVTLFASYFPCALAWKRLFSRVNGYFPVWMAISLTWFFSIGLWNRRITSTVHRNFCIRLHSTLPHNKEVRRARREEKSRKKAVVRWSFAHIQSELPRKTRVQHNSYIQCAVLNAVCEYNEVCICNVAGQNTKVNVQMLAHLFRPFSNVESIAVRLSKSGRQPNYALLPNEKFVHGIGISYTLYLVGHVVSICGSCTLSLCVSYGKRNSNA